jgi:hypothetical protein
MAVTANYQRAYELSQDANFQNRLKIAILDQVAVVATEATNTPNNANRLILAAMAAYDPTPWAQKMALGVIVASAQIQGGIAANNTPAQSNAAVTDAQIQASVGNVWNFYANAAVAIQAASKGAI